jgi:hypothetical protein
VSGLGELLVHYSARPVKLERNWSYLPQEEHKPRGFWVSVEGEDSYGWAEWCAEENFRCTSLAVRHLVTLHEKNNVLWIDSNGGLDSFHVQYGNSCSRAEGIDWARVAKRWQGVIIAPYLYERRFSYLWYYGWDCASGCIWDLEAIESVVVTSATSLPVMGDER